MESTTIIAILLVLFAFKYPTSTKEPITFPKDDIDTIVIDNIPITNPIKKPPKPPKPSILIEVPNHKTVEDPVGDINIDWENGDQLRLPDEPGKLNDEKYLKS